MNTFIHIACVFLSKLIHCVKQETNIIIIIIIIIICTTIYSKVVVSTCSSWPMTSNHLPNRKYESLKKEK
jgi:hypothetical protein